MKYCPTRPGSCSFRVILLFILFTAPAGAEIFYDAGVKATYEDNVVGLLTGETSGTTGSDSGNTAMSPAMGSWPGPGPGPGSRSFYTGTSSAKMSDTSLDISAEFGAFIPWGDAARLFFSGAAQRIVYSTFTEFNMTAGGLSAGVTRQFRDRITARAAVAGLEKRYAEPARDSSAYRGSIVLKERLSSRFWLKEGYAYERNKAESDFFTYTGNSFQLVAGYDAAARTLLFAGDSYLVREYDEPPDFEEKANTLSLGLEQEIAGKWFLDLQYDRRASDSTLPGTSTAANIYTIGARYSY